MAEDSIVALGEHFAASGYFPDARQPAQAIVKIHAGRELGFGPVASMTGVQIIKGRVCLSAALMAAAIKRLRPRYDYRVEKLADDECVLVFMADGSEAGKSTFSRADAERAKLAGGDNWRHYPRNMLFARALSNGAKWYCPDAFAGSPVYTPEELGAAVDADGEIISAAPQPAHAETQSNPPPQPANVQQRPAAQALDQATASVVPANAADQAMAEIGRQLAGPNLTRLRELIDSHNLSVEQQAGWCSHFNVSSLEQLAQSQVDAIVNRILQAIEKGA